MAEIFPELYSLTSKDFSIANSENIKNFQKDGYSLDVGGEIVNKQGRIMGGVTDIFGSGKVIISLAKAREGILSFASTWYHEGIHSMHAMSGFAMKVYADFTNLGFKNVDRMAIDVSEVIAHLTVTNMGGSPTLKSTMNMYISSFNVWLKLSH